MLYFEKKNAFCKMLRCVCERVVSVVGRGGCGVGERVASFSSYSRVSPKANAFMSYAPRSGSGFSTFLVPLRSFDKSLITRAYNRPAWKSRSVLETVESESTIPAAHLSKKSLLLYGAAGAAAGLMLMGLVADGNREHRDATTYTSIEKSRIHATYSYLLGGIGSTAAFATAMFRTGFAQRMLTMNPWVVLGGR